jgi:hypothetical protein
VTQAAGANVQGLEVGRRCAASWSSLLHRMVGKRAGAGGGPWFGASSSAELRRKASIAQVAPRWLRPSVAGVSCNLVACMPHVTSFFFRMLQNMCLARGWQKVSGSCMLCSALHGLCYMCFVNAAVLHRAGWEWGGFVTAAAAAASACVAMRTYV